MADETTGTGSTELTEYDAAALFERMDSEEENPSPRRGQPAPESDEDEALSDETEETAPEDGTEVEDEPAETDEETDDSEEEPDESEPAADRKFKVKVAGEEIEVTFDELRRGYSREADYTRKSQALAEERKAAKQAHDAAREKAETYAVGVQQVLDTLEALMPQEPDWDALRAQDPDGYAYQWTEWQRAEKQRAALEAERDQAMQTALVARQAELQEQVKAEREKLIAAVPVWKDAAVMKQDYAKLVEYAGQHGYTEQDVKGITDHRAVLLLRKAMLFDQLQAKKPAAQQKLKPAPVAKPGNPGAKGKPMPNHVKARLNLAKKGDLKSAQDYFMALDD